MSSSSLISISEAKAYIGKPISALPVPSFIIDKSIIDSNAGLMKDKLNTIEQALGKPLAFRPHIKTLKTVEVTRAALAGISKRVVASTLAEIRGVRELVESGEVNDILYGVPIGASKVAEIAHLQKEYDALSRKGNGSGCSLSVFVDHPDQLTYLSADATWNIFVKTDSHDNRAGVPIDSEEFTQILTTIKATPRFSLLGFYVHAGTSYGSESLDQARTHVERELITLSTARDKARSFFGEQGLGGLTLSFGATPTAHAVSQPDVASYLLDTSGANQADQFELHAGNFVALDLQQVSTSLCETSQIAGYVQSEIISRYPHRGPHPDRGGEYLINAGVLALTREPGRLGGLAHAKGHEGWKVTRVSQEHGILAYEGNGHEGVETKVEGPWKIGDRVLLYPQHMCISSAMHLLYFIVDGGETVVDVWQPWKGW